MLRFIKGIEMEHSVIISCSTCLIFKNRLVKVIEEIIQGTIILNSLSSVD